MKFNEHQLVYYHPLMPQSVRSIPIRTFYDKATDLATSGFTNVPGIDVDKDAACWRLICERLWVKQQRSYYRVWPAIFSCFTKFRLSISPKDLSLPARIIEIRTPCTNGGLPALLVAALSTTTESRVATKLIVVSAGNNSLNTGFLVMSLDGDSPIDTLLVSSGYNKNNPWRHAANAIRLAISVLLLADDPSIIEADVLSADAADYERTGDQKYVDRAHRRGKIGWNIGKSFEMMPHFRRPHFALFHTGPGRTIPRILPVKGCVVHRQKVVAVPTGYISDDGSEVEGAE
jgi:hypothetical protein